MRSAAGTAAVQLNDGPLVDADFLKHARAQRKLPGEGELDIVGLIRAVQATGYSGPYCVEVNTPEYAHFPWARPLDGPRTPPPRCCPRRWCDRRQAPRQPGRSTTPLVLQPDEGGPTADLQR